VNQQGRLFLSLPADCQLGASTSERPQKKRKKEKRSSTFTLLDQQQQQQQQQPVSRLSLSRFSLLLDSSFFYLPPSTHLLTQTSTWYLCALK
jgi:hypothetical protein